MRNEEWGMRNEEWRMENGELKVFEPLVIKLG
jgi:hypothetical protein